MNYGESKVTFAVTSVRHRFGSDVRRSSNRASHKRSPCTCALGAQTETDCARKCAIGAPKKTRGRSIPCRNATNNEHATAATSVQTSAPSVSVIVETLPQEQGHDQGQPEALPSASTSGSQPTVTNNVLSTLPGNGETLVINKDALTELISME